MEGGPIQRTDLNSLGIDIESDNEHGQSPRCEETDKTSESQIRLKFSSAVQLQMKGGPIQRAFLNSTDP